MTLVGPESPIVAESLQLTPLTMDDATELEKICDVDGFQLLEIPSLEAQQLKDEPCRAIWIWAVQRSADWGILDWDVPGYRPSLCFAVRRLEGAGQLAGLVGFERPADAELEGGLNIYYWTTPHLRHGGVAPRAVRVGVMWAFNAWEATTAYIRPTTEASEKVAVKAGFVPTPKQIRGKPLFRLKR